MPIYLLMFLVLHYHIKLIKVGSFIVALLCQSWCVKGVINPKFRPFSFELKKIKVSEFYDFGN